MIKAVFFDMDGTILNTLSDLTNAINYAFEKTGHKASYSDRDTKIFFGSGIRVAIKRGLASEQGKSKEELFLIGTDREKEVMDFDEKEIDRIQDIYMPYYSKNCNNLTGPYPGIKEMIEKLRKKGIKTAVVSNKPDIAVKKLSDEVFTGLFDVAIGEKPEIKRKPAPDMLRKAMELLEVEVNESLYIGDSEIDMLTAENVNMRSIICDWGFRDREFLSKKGASLIVSTADSLYEEIIRSGF